MSWNLRHIMMQVSKTYFNCSYSHNILAWHFKSMQISNLENKVKIYMYKIFSYQIIFIVH